MHAYWDTERCLIDAGACMQRPLRMCRRDIRNLVCQQTASGMTEGWIDDHMIPTFIYPVYRTSFYIPRRT